MHPGRSIETVADCPFGPVLQRRREDVEEEADCICCHTMDTEVVVVSTDVVGTVGMEWERRMDPVEVVRIGMALVVVVRMALVVGVHSPHTMDHEVVGSIVRWIEE